MSSRPGGLRPPPNVPKHAARADVPTHARLRAVVQPAGATPRRPPPAPPVYRPQQQTPKAPAPYNPPPAPKVLQRKPRVQPAPVSPHRPTPAAPPVYRPQPTPLVLQRKAACVPAHAARTHAAPAAANVLQAKFPAAHATALTPREPFAQTARRPSQGVVQLMKDDDYRRPSRRSNRDKDRDRDRRDRDREKSRDRRSKEVEGRHSKKKEKERGSKRKDRDEVVVPQTKPERPRRGMKQPERLGMASYDDFEEQLEIVETKEIKELEEKQERVQKSLESEREKLLKELKEQEKQPAVKKQKTVVKRPWKEDERPELQPNEVGGLLDRKGVMELILSASHESLRRLWVTEGLVEINGEPTVKGREFILDVMANKPGYLSTAKFTFLMHCGEPEYLEKFESTKELSKLPPPKQLTLEEWGKHNITLQKVNENSKTYRGMQLHPCGSYVAEKDFYSKLVDEGKYEHRHLAQTNLIGPKDKYKEESKIKDKGQNVHHRGGGYLMKFEMGRYTMSALPQKVAMVNVRNTEMSITDYQLNAPMSDGKATTATKSKNITSKKHKETVEEIHRRCKVSMVSFITTYLTNKALLTGAEQDYAEAVVYILWKQKRKTQPSTEVKEYLYQTGSRFARSPSPERETKNNSNDSNNNL